MSGAAAAGLLWLAKLAAAADGALVQPPHCVHVRSGCTGGVVALVLIVLSGGVDTVRVTVRVTVRNSESDTVAERQ